MYAYNFDKSFINTFQKKVDELTASRASEIIRNYFPAEHLQFVMIGKASEIREQVKKYGEISEKCELRVKVFRKNMDKNLLKI
jgi:hypothetical protein